MKISATLLAGLVWLSLGLMTVPASADTLQMKDGRVIQGRFFGGTQASVQFETNGKVELFDVDDIISVTFTNPTSSAHSNPPGEVTPPPASMYSRRTKLVGSRAASAKVMMRPGWRPRVGRWTRNGPVPHS